MRGIEYSAELDSLAGAIGAIQGAAKVIENEKYMDMLITEAHNKAKGRFNTDTAAYAVATGTLNHMFEWGTVGINQGKSNMRLDPTSPAAQLWTHKLTGPGGDKVASFNFRPSMAHVPAPTPQKTGVPGSELAKLTGGPYVFHAKAAVMEAGIRVTIRPKESTHLFVPFGDEGPRSDNARHNFVLTKSPVNTIPGASLAGNFSKYWMFWWSTQGVPLMTENIQEQVDDDTENLLDSIGRRMGRRRRRMSAMTFSADVERARKMAEREMYGRKRR